MIRRPPVPALIALLMLPAAGHAQLALHAGVEYFRWKERTTPAVEETGAMFAFGFDYTQRADAGFLFAYRGRIWGGDVDYDGATLFTGDPVKSTTSYFGVTNELQARWRRPIEDGYFFDLVFGAGWDGWRRELSPIQKEDFDIVYLRLGTDFDTFRTDRWMIGLGVKFPMWAREDAHLTALGFDRNPILKPKRDVSAYAQVGYRFDRNWRVVGYADGYRFRESDAEPVTHATEGAMFVFQPASSMLNIGVKVEYSLR